MNKVLTYIKNNSMISTAGEVLHDSTGSGSRFDDGYYQIDSSNHAKLPGREFTRLHSDLKGSRDALKNEIEILNMTKGKVSDLVCYSGSRIFIMDCLVMENPLR